jgi:hypothetical protein
MVTVPIRQEELSRLMRPAPGGGGFQRLIERLRAGIEGGTISMSLADADRLLRYTRGYGRRGGWQARLAFVADRAAGRAAELRGQQALPIS